VDDMITYQLLELGIVCLQEHNVGTKCV